MYSGIDLSLVFAVVVLGSVFRRSKKEEKSAPPATDLPPEPAETPEASEIRALRAANRVELVDRADEGKGIVNAPNGVYGFTFSPHQESPIFRKRMHESFEVHKLKDGSVYLVGFVTNGEAEDLSAQDKYVDITLYPDQWEDSTNLVCIERERVLRGKGPARSEGNPLYLELGPVSSAIQ
jgi:hypothetical protein